MFRRLFGDSKLRENRDDARRTIEQLKQSEDLLNKKIEKFDEEILDIQNKARQCLIKPNPDRPAAIRLIKRRKQLEVQRDKLYQMKENLELVNEQVQTSHFNRQVTESLNIGQEHLKRSQKTMPTKKIEEILDNITEQMDVSNEINQLLSVPIATTDTLINDIDLDKELNLLENESLHLPSAHSETIQLPEIREKSSVDKQLDELQRLVTG